MIEQQIINSIMMANCNKFFGGVHSPSSSSSLQHHPQQQQPTAQTHTSVAVVTKNSANNNSNNNNLVKIMSNSVAEASGATNSTAMMNNTTTNGMSSSVGNTSGLIGSGAVAASTSPVSSLSSQQQPAIANKMGSRRIFSPHFKIQVLESYRNDNDCKGNQRATARKYGIHRRQIQKWLQCETALRTSVSNSGTGGVPSPTSSSNSPGGASSSTSSPVASSGAHKAVAVDSNNNSKNNNPKREQLHEVKAPPLPSTSSNHQARARHSVVGEFSSVRASASAEEVLQAHSRLTGGCASVSDTNTLTRLGGSSTHTRPNSMEFFSLTTTSLIINGHGGASAGGSGRSAVDGGGVDWGRKMNEAAVPIKPEFCFNPAASSTSSAAVAPQNHHHHHQHPHQLHPSMSRGVEFPSTAAMLNQHRLQDESPHHSLIAPTVLPPSFISTIYGPGLLAYPTPRLPPCSPFGFDFSSLLTNEAAASAVPQRNLSTPIDLSVGNAERRCAIEYRRSPLIHVDDARVPSRGVSGDGSQFNHFSVSQSPPLSVEVPASSPIDLSCSRKRKASPGPVDPVKPPKLFKPYLLDDKEEEEELKVVDDADESLSTASLKDDSFLDQDLTGLKDKPRFEYPILWPRSSNGSQHHHQYYPGSPVYDNFYYGHESLTLYPSPRQQCRYELSSSSSSLSPSATSSPQHHPSRPASIFDSSASSEGSFGNYHPNSPTSSEVRASPPVFSLDLKMQSLVSSSCTSVGWEERTRFGICLN